MVDVIIIAHSEIANSFAQCVEHILAKRVEHLHILPVRKTEDVDSIVARVKAFIEQVAKDNEVLILADIFGATPSNIASKVVRKGKVELLTGLNMPMLLRAVSYAQDGLATCVEKALDGAKSGIVYVSGE
jgi:PTS system ascorbate-specific IIA component